MMEGSECLRYPSHTYVGFPFFLPKESSLAFSVWSPCLVFAFVSG